jgi:hypothetical protein
MSSLVLDSHRCHDGALLVYEWQKGVGYVVGKLVPDRSDQRMVRWSTKYTFNTKAKAEKAFVNRVYLDRKQAAKRNPTKRRR